MRACPRSEGLSRKTEWFMCHRIRLAIRMAARLGADGSLARAGSAAFRATRCASRASDGPAYRSEKTGRRGRPGSAIRGLPLLPEMSIQRRGRAERTRRSPMRSWPEMGSTTSGSWRTTVRPQACPVLRLAERSSTQPRDLQRFQRRWLKAGTENL